MLNWMRWLPENVSTYGGEIDAVIALIYYVTLAWFFLTLGVFGFFLIRWIGAETRGSLVTIGLAWFLFC